MEVHASGLCMWGYNEHVNCRAYTIGDPGIAQCCHQTTGWQVLSSTCTLIIDKALLQACGKSAVIESSFDDVHHNTALFLHLGIFPLLWYEHLRFFNGKVHRLSIDNEKIGSSISGWMYCCDQTSAGDSIQLLGIGRGKFKMNII